MKKYIYTIISGFTLVEFLVNIIIVTGITLSMFFLFSNIQENINNEDNYSDILNYGNRVLDELETEMSLASTINTVFQTNDFTIINLTYPNNNKTLNYLISSNEGLVKNDVPFDNFINKDSHDRLKYEIKRFNIENNLSKILGSESDTKDFNILRTSSYLITLEIDIFNRSEKIIRTIKLERKFYSPSKYIDIKINNKNYDV